MLTIPKAGEDGKKKKGNLIMHMFLVLLKSDTATLETDFTFSYKVKCTHITQQSHYQGSILEKLKLILNKNLHKGVQQISIYNFPKLK